MLNVNPSTTDRRRKLPQVLLFLVVLAALSPAAWAAEQYDASIPKPTESEVRYGPHARNVLDLWLAESDKPTPLVFIIHGGGWSGGSKERAGRFADIPKLLDAGISVVAINYRLINKAPKQAPEIDTTQNPPVHTPLHDAARALQFVRSKAEAWKIDSERVALVGGSAGACTSLWLAFHDDLAQPESEDPVLRQSTRVAFAAVQGAQTTLDPRQMKQWTPNSKYGGHAFGFKNFNSFLEARDQIKPWIAEYSPYALVSKDDPPVYLRYFAKPEIGKRQSDPTHTANFGLKLKEHCEAMGVACDLYYPGAPQIKHNNSTDYLIEKFKGD